METIELGLTIALFMLGWLAKGMIWVSVDTYLLGNEYCDPIKTLINVLLWPISVLIRVLSYI
jgi:TM2 domain-containing membrane protein YozV